LRHTYPDLASSAGYTTLEPDGEGANHWIAFARQHEDAALITAVPRFPASFDPSTPATLSLPDDWAHATWSEWLTGTPVAPGTAWTLGQTPLPWAVLVTDQ
jgi:maltooligosyltrehalose synthase